MKALWLLLGNGWLALLVHHLLSPRSDIMLADPATALVVAGVGAAAASAVTAYTQYEAAQAQADAQKYNAKVSRQQAEAATQAGKFEAEQIREKARAIAGENVAATGGQGIRMEGSPIEVLKRNAREAEMEARIAQYAGESQAVGLEAEARLAKFSARTIRRLAPLQSAATLLGGAAQAGAYVAAGQRRQPPQQ